MDINHTVIIDAEDTDVIILSARVAHELDGILGVKWKKDVFDCKKLCSRDMAKIIVQWYILTGADSLCILWSWEEVSDDKYCKNNRLFTLFRQSWYATPDH